MWFVFGVIGLALCLPIGSTLKRYVTSFLLLMPTVLLVYTLTEGLSSNPCGPKPSCPAEDHPLLSYLFYWGFGVIITAPFWLIAWFTFKDKCFFKNKPNQ